ncbi:hypothetical protein GINT2_001428 [Glugoides intestinalis]
MGRKSTRKSIKKQSAPKLEIQFDCPICSQENAVQCKIISKTHRGIVMCNICESHFGCAVSALDKPIDIYHLWVDKLSNEKSSK